MADPSDIESGGPLTSKKLRAIADLLDYADKGMLQLAAIKDIAVKEPLGAGMQDDLRRWAKEIDLGELWLLNPIQE